MPWNQQPESYGEPPTVSAERKRSSQGLGSLVDALEKTGEATMLLKLLQRLDDSTF